MGINTSQNSQTQANSVPNGLPQDSTKSTNTKNTTKVSFASRIDSTVSVRNAGILLRLGFLGVAIFIVVSITFNILQAIEDTCLDLEDEVADLEEENLELESSLDDLLAFQQQLNESITSLDVQNDQLQLTIDSLAETNTQLAENLSTLENAEEDLTAVMLLLNTTYSGFLESLPIEDLMSAQEVLATFNSRMEVMSDDILSLEEDLEALNESGAALEVIKASTEEKYQFLSQHSQFYNQLVIRQGEAETLLEESYETFLDELQSIFGLSNADINILEDEFPWTTSFGYLDAKELLPRIRELQAE